MKRYRDQKFFKTRDRFWLNLGPNDNYGADLIPTLDEVHDMFGPARTLGAPPEKRRELWLAADASLEHSGVYNLIQHAWELGQGFGPAGQFMGYPALSSLPQNGLVSACIETVADDMTRAWIKITAESGPNHDDAKLLELHTAMRHFDLKSLFHQAAIMTGYFGGCLIFIDTGLRGDQLAEPLNLTEMSAELKPGELRGLTLLEPINAFPGEYNSLDPLSPHYFEPIWWWVNSRRVHASRLIRITSGLPPVLIRPAYNFFGIPHAQIIYDYVLHFQENRLSAQRLLSKFSRLIFKTNMADILTQAGGTTQLDRRIELMAREQSNDAITAIDMESEDVASVDTPISGVTDIVRQDLELIAAINRTPAVKLLGLSPAGFNATGEADLRNYYDHIQSQAEKQLRPGIQKALEILQLNASGRINPDLTFTFNPLSDDDQRIRQQADKTRAETRAIYLQHKVISPEEVKAELTREE